MNIPIANRGQNDDEGLGHPESGNPATRRARKVEKQRRRQTRINLALGKEKSRLLIELISAPATAEAGQVGGRPITYEK